MDQQNHNTPQANGDITGAHLCHHHHQQQQLRTLWADMYREIEQMKIFKNMNLSLTTIKKIMETDEDVQMIDDEALVVFACAYEMFILELTHRAWTHAEKNKHQTLQKNDIVAAIRQTDRLEFLEDIV
ncbi:nuclear transcription factor Y subunit C-2-like [Dendrobium catenatum]|uniref:Nuclear transcription factor Y subunit C-4 n=1 Tax=Dendrobium catenatum TaxID=906689 RepID=A0A2I0WGL7_9ASPA|nr:nuclear transcription factor Y subunit C-2-like [Dendrobium catenatum]PKU74817.1 Nuclear transcription factor Y subunit C-4 [Dendrobium catenatum]